MKFGVYYAYWEQEWDADYPAYCEKISKLGFDILEVSGGSLVEKNAAELKAIKAAAQDNGIDITVCLGLPKALDVSAPEEKIRKQGIEYIKRVLNAAYEAGSHLLGGILYAYWPCEYTGKEDKQQAWEAAVGSVAEVAKTARDLDILLALETVNRYEHYLINCAAEAKQFIKEIGSPYVKVMLDSYHMNIEEDFLGDAIRNTGSDLGHFHIGECNRKVPGRGHMPWSEIGQALHDIHYNGAVVMEPFVKMGGTVGRDIKVWRDLSNGAGKRQLDDEIKSALCFIKHLFNT